MPCFHFDIAEGEIIRDSIAVELAGAAEARSHAIRLAGEMLQQAPERLDRQDLRIEVCDDDKLLLHTIIVVAIDSAAGRLRVA